MSSHYANSHQKAINLLESLPAWPPWHCLRGVKKENGRTGLEFDKAHDELLIPGGVVSFPWAMAHGKHFLKVWKCSAQSGQYKGTKKKTEKTSLALWYTQKKSDKYDKYIFPLYNYSLINVGPFEMSVENKLKRGNFRVNLKWTAGC